MPEVDAEDALAETAAQRVRAGNDDIWMPIEFVQDDIPPPKAPLPAIAVQIGRMSIMERVKTAILGGKDARMILARDANRVVRRYVLANPRITDGEIVGIARNRNLDTDILRIVGEHKEWSHNPQVRSALVSNPKTPVAIALRCVNSLSERELRLLAKSKNISSAVASSAKRLLIQRTGH